MSESFSETSVSTNYGWWWFTFMQSSPDHFR